MSRDKSATTLGLSEDAHRKLKKLKEENVFQEMVDGYRFAIALALAHGVTPQPIEGRKTTIFNVGTLDPEGSLAAAVGQLTETLEHDVYATAERLAEWGVEEMDRRSMTGTLRISEILDEVGSLN